MTSEVELLALLARAFPSLQALPQAAQLERAEQLGLFLAQGWGVGAAGLQQRGLEVPPEAVAALAPAAQACTQARRGGAAFLAQLRQGLRDDARFHRVAIALGALFARSRPASSGPQPVVSPAAPGTATPARGTVAAQPSRPAPAPGPAAVPGAGGAAAGGAPARLSGSGTFGAVPPPPGRATGTFAAVAPPGAPAPGTTPPPGRTTGTFAAASLPPPPAPPAARPTPAPATPAPVPARPAHAEDEFGSLDAGFDAGALSDLEGAPAPAAPARSVPTPAPAPAKSPESDDLAGLDDLDLSHSSTPGVAATARAGRPTPAPRAPADDLSGLDDLDLTGSSAPAETAAPDPLSARASAPAPTATDAPGFLASLVGGGLASAPAPASAPPPAPRPAAPGIASAPAPAAKLASAPAAGATSRGATSPGATSSGATSSGATSSGWDAFEQALASGGPVFKDEAESGEAPPPAPNDAPAPEAAPAPKVAPAPPAAREPSDLDLLPDEPAPSAPGPGAAPRAASEAPAATGGLDLLPEEPPATDEPQVDQRILDEPIAPKASPRQEGGRLKKAMSAVKIEEFSLDSNDGAGGESPRADGAEDESREEAAPKDPAQAAVFRFERTGDPVALNEARKLFQETAATAPHGTARAFAEAGLAKVYLLAGNGPAAEQTARAALERDPGNPFAVEVVVKVSRGEAERARLATGLAQARTLIGMGRTADARALLERKLAAEHPEAPQPWLLAALIAKAEGDDPRFDQMLAQAWARYPGKKHGDLPLGGTLDIDLAALIAAHGRSRFKPLDPEFLKRTIEAIDAKENTVAGTFRLAIACARLGLARATHLTRAARRKAWTTIASGLIGLQFYDAAIEALDKAQKLRPTEVESKLLEAERRYAGQMRRAFDKPGVKAQLGRYKCLGVQVLSQATQDKLAAAQRDRAAREGELLKEAAQVAALCASDPRIRDEVRAAAESQHREDPVIHIEVVEAELAQLRDERARLADPNKPAPERKSGIFSKLAGAAQAAADKVAQAAKDAQLKLRESQVQAKRDEAVRKLGLAIAKDLRDHAWKTPQLVAFAKRAAGLEAFIDFHAEEERLAKVELEALAKSVA